MKTLLPSLDATYLNKPCIYNEGLTVIIHTDTNQEGDVIVCIPVPKEVSASRTLWVKVDDVGVQHDAVYLSHAPNKRDIGIVMYNYPNYKGIGCYFNSPFGFYPKGYLGNGEKFGAVGIWKLKNHDMKPIERLREEFKKTLNSSQDDRLLRRRQYYAVKAFTLDCNLVSFNDIELMEYEESNK